MSIFFRKHTTDIFNRFLLASFFITALCFLGSCKEGTSPDDEVIARVGNATYKIKDLKAALPKGEYTNITDAQIRAYVQRWINTELLCQEARKIGLHKEEDIKLKLRDSSKELLASALLDKVLNDSVSVSEEEMQEYFTKNKEMFLRAEEEVRVYQILVSTRTEANRLRTRIRNGEDFSELAREHSLDPSAEHGGDMGYFSRNQALPQLARAAFSLGLNRLSYPVATDLGFHLLQVVDRQPAGSVMDLSQVQDNVREQVIYQKLRRNHLTLIADLRRNTSIETHFDLVNTLLFDSTRIEGTK